VILRSHLRRRRLVGSSPGAPAPFVVGVGRSGTTLLRLMLDAHPAMAIPPETHFLPALIDAFSRLRVTPERVLEAIEAAPQSGWVDSGVPAAALLERLRAIKPLNAPDSIRAFYGLYAERAGKDRWGDKTPRYVTALARIGRAVPEARFVHMIRDGRDVALSTNRRLVELRGSRPVPAERMAKRWRHRILSARRVSQVGGRYLELRYEDLVRDTEPSLRRVCELVELDFDPVMLRYHERAAERLQEMNRERRRGSRQSLSGEERMQAHAMTTKPPQAERVEVWKGEMDDGYRREFEQFAGDLLAELGYETGAAVAAGAADPRLPS
jgi:sulfotransferase family protein